MGRPRKHRLDLPARVYFEDGRYRYKPKGGKPVELGADYGEAMAAWGKVVRIQTGAIRTMADLGDAYMAKIATQKASRTHKDNIGEWANLRPAFGHLLPSEVTPPMVYKYMEARGARVRANREKALLSHILTYGVYLGLLERHPIAWQMRRSMIGHGERPRRRLPSDRDLDTFCATASEMIRCYVEFKQLTGLRKGDILTLRKPDLGPEGIAVMPRKGRRRDPVTGERVGKERLIRWNDGLRACVARVEALKRRAGRLSPYLFATRNGASYYDEDASRSDGFDAIWKRYMAKAQAAAKEQGWELEHFTEHDVRAKAGVDYEKSGGKGHKLLGNSEAMFRKTYDRGVEVVEPGKVFPVTPEYSR